MKLSIIVLTHNRRDALRDCLNRLRAHTAERDAELIVVDNGSTDGTWEMLGVAWAFPFPLRLIHRDVNEGVCARNYAIDRAAGVFIAQVDDDVLVSPGWDTMLLGPMCDPSIGATGQHGFYQEQRWSRQHWSAGLIDDRRRPSPGQFCDLVMGFCWAWRNDYDAHALSGRLFRYDERFNPFWHEESDLQLQIRAAGYRIMCVRPIASHLSLPHKRPREDDLAIAAEHFDLLRKKWAGEEIRFEGKAVGL